MRYQLVDMVEDERRIVKNIMKTREFFIGPMSKNVVDAVLLHNESSSNKIGFIPSRRQIDYNGGYVNNWTTETFSEYVGDKAVIQRDHGGVGQGHKYDSGNEISCI